MTSYLVILSEAKNPGVLVTRDASLTLSGTLYPVILSEAKNLGVPVTRDASLTLSMTFLFVILSEAKNLRDASLTLSKTEGR